MSSAHDVVSSPDDSVHRARVSSSGALSSNSEPTSPNRSSALLSELAVDAVGVSVGEAARRRNAAAARFADSTAEEEDEDSDGHVDLLGPGEPLSDDEEEEEAEDELGTLGGGGGGGGGGDGGTGGAGPADAVRQPPFEFRVLEVALETACGRLEAEVVDLEAHAAPALDALVATVSAAHVERLKRIRGALARLSARVTAARSEVQRLLDDDSDMRDMFLTRKAAGRAKLATIWLGVRAQTAGGSSAGEGAAVEAAAAAARAAAHEALLAEGHVEEDDDLQELEDLLETYFAQLDAAANRLAVLRQVITDTEEYVEVGLDSKRNTILEFNICVGFAVLVHSIASATYGVLGMNFIQKAQNGDATDLDASGAVPNPLPRSQRGTFNFVAIFVMFAAVVVWLAIIASLKNMGYLHILPGIGSRRAPGRHLLAAEALLDDNFAKAQKAAAAAATPPQRVH